MRLFFLLLTLPLIFASPSCRPTFARHDCNKGDQNSCQQAGCCWNPTNQPGSGESGTPWCYRPQSINAGYRVTSSSSNANGKTLKLGLSGGDAYWGPDITSLSVDVIYQDVDTVRVIIRDADKPRWEVPTTILPQPTSTNPSPASLNYIFTYTTQPFGFAVTRLDDGMVLFNTTPPTTNGQLEYNSLTYTDQYLEITTQIPEQPHIYGLGEHVGPLHLAADGSKITMWARDAGDPVGENIYGTHPFYMEMRDGVTHGVFLRNSNGMDVVISPKTLQYRVIGGILDFSIFVGGTPEQTVQQYHRVIGTPHMPPFWSLGWHQCRWGYKNLDEVKAVVSNYANHSIPLDTMWTDIDYMHNYEDFSTDPTNFPTAAMSSYINQLHTQGQHYVVIIDPAIHNRVGYSTYDTGVQQDVFVKRANGDIFIGKVWPGLTAFPSFFKNQTQAWWQQQIQNFLDTVPVDGLWIDMNEPSNFCNGQCTSEKIITKQKSVVGFNPNDPPYRIHNANTGAPLNVKTIDPDAKYGDDPNLIGYNVHNLYGMSESIATANSLENIRPIRSLVISRSTYAGQGHHAGHWLGDNVSTWESMMLSLPGILAMNLFGIPLVGADICGFNGATTEELCARWSAVGAFYPFARNHNSEGQPSQEPYTWNSVATISRKVLAARYSLLPYYNSMFAYVHQYGGTVARPLFFEFPSDVDTWKIDSQFLIGPGLLISPVLTQGANNVDIYLPSTSVWYDFWTNTTVRSTGHINVKAPLDTIPVHLRGGIIYPMQQPAMTTVLQRSNPYELRVCLDRAGQAYGDLFIDDGEELKVGTSAIKMSYQAQGNSLVGYVQQDTYTPKDYDLVINTITILGITSNITQVIINDNNSTSYRFDNNANVLYLTNIQLPVAQNLKVAWN